MPTPVRPYECRQENDAYLCLLCRQHFGSQPTPGGPLQNETKACSIPFLNFGRVLPGQKIELTRPRQSYPTTDNDVNTGEQLISTGVRTTDDKLDNSNYDSDVRSCAMSAHATSYDVNPTSKSHGSTMHNNVICERPSQQRSNTLKALAVPSTTHDDKTLAEPSTINTASAVPSNKMPKDSHMHDKADHTTPCPKVATRPVLTIKHDAVKKQKDIITSHWPNVTNKAKDQYPKFCELFAKIRSFNLPNFLGARIPIESGLNIPAWRKRLESYHDIEVCEFLEFGWPIGYHASKTPVNSEANHPSAQFYTAHVKKFIETELDHNALVGPFSEPPFRPWTKCSPIMTRPKKDSMDRRIIIDMSFPLGRAVNDGISTEDYFGRNITYTLPTISDLIARIQQQGQAAYLWKADLARAYRQLRIDPIDTPFLGICFNGQYYLDLCPPFGCKSSSAACQRVSNALSYLMASDGHFILSYLDDYAGCNGSYQQAQASFEAFKALAQDLGLNLAEHKCVAPTTSIEWLGYKIDSVNMIVSIPALKLKEFVKICKQWLTRRRAKKKSLQSLAGKMAYISGCVSQGRKFMCRVLATIRSMRDRDWTTLSDDFRLDVKWFYLYSKAANGVALFSLERTEFEVECDSSLQGAGGAGGSLCYNWKYTATHTKTFNNIHELEAVNVIVAFNTLCPSQAPQGAKIIIYTDNISSACALESGRTSDPTLGACSRELWLLAARHDFVINIVHKPGNDIPLSDALSRFHQDSAKADLATAIIAQRNLRLVQPVLNNYLFFTPSI